MANPFTLEEDQFIIENYQKMTNTEIVCVLGRLSRHSIQRRIKTLRRFQDLPYGFVSGGVFHPDYSKEEDEIIKEFYPYLGPRLLAKRLNRSWGSIQYRALRLRTLKVKKTSPAYLSPVKIARLLGVGRRTVLIWVHQGFLKASKSGHRANRFQEWRIEPQSLYDFVRDYYYLFEPDRVRDKSLLSIIELTPAAKAIPVCQAIKILGVSRTRVIKQAKAGKFPVAYKGFGPNGSSRWYIQLDNIAFQWFLDLIDDRAAEWIVETARLRNADSVEHLNILLKYVPERVKEVRERIKVFLVADSIVRAFEASPEGERLKNLVD